MNELIRVELNEKQEAITTGRELHEFLEIGTQYTKWFDKMKEYGFDENVDYIAISQKRLTAQGNETEYTDHIVKIDMAKEIAMLQRTEKGKQARQYFIECEKRLRGQLQIAPPNDGTIFLATHFTQMATMMSQYITANNEKMEQIQESIIKKDEQIDKVVSLIGLKTRQIMFLSELLKEKLSIALNQKVKASDTVYVQTKIKIQLKYHSTKWEDIAINKYNEVHSFIDTLDKDVLKELGIRF